MVVGGGPAGFSAGFALRDLGYDGSLVLVSEEPALPYRRSELSKGYLRGEVGAEDLLLAPLDAYRRAGIDLLLGARATGLEPATRTVTIRGHGLIRYGRVIVATGSNPIDTLPGPPPHRIWTRRDADNLRESAMAGDRAIVVGAGSMGLDVAVSLRRLGLGVVVVDDGDPAISEAGSRLRGLRDLGVELRLATRVVELEGDDHATRVRTACGDRVEGDLVVLATGSIPASDLLVAARIQLAPDVEQRHGGATSDPSVFVAGGLAGCSRCGATREESANSGGVAAARAAYLPIAGSRSRRLRSTLYRDSRGGPQAEPRAAEAIGPPRLHQRRLDPETDRGVIAK